MYSNINIFFKLILIIIIFYIIYNHINGDNYYLITIFLIKIIPFIFILFLIFKTEFLFIILTFYISYLVFIYDRKRVEINKIQENKIYNLNYNLNYKYVYKMNLDSKKYINYNIHNKLELQKDTKQNYIYLLSPHALYAHAFMHLFGNKNNIISNNVIGLVHKFFFTTPFLGNLFENCGYLECCDNNIEILLKEKKSIALLPGGLDETCLTSSNCENIFIKKRYGIFKFSYKYKVPIIPIYCIGESDFYKLGNIFTNNIFTNNIFTNNIFTNNKFFKLFIMLFSYGKIKEPWKPIYNTIDIIFGNPIIINNNKNINNIYDLKNIYIDNIKKLHKKLNIITNKNRILNIL